VDSSKVRIEIPVSDMEDKTDDILKDLQRESAPKPPDTK
jgi:hypothetical protein